MLRFKSYLNEAFNLGIIDPDEVPEIVSTEQDATQLKRLFNYLKRLKSEEAARQKKKDEMKLIRQAQNEQNEWYRR